VDLVNTFYGRGSIPVGVVKNGKTPEDSRMIQVPAERKTGSGAWLYPRRIEEGANAEDAVALLRRVLRAQPDGSVVVIQVGFSTNLARLLAADRDLITRKVRLLSLMGGDFSGGKPEYNIRIDIPAARQVFEQWPSPIVVSGFEIGKEILYPARSVERDFAYVPNHPVADAYRAYQKMPYDRPTWDLTSVLYAARPDRGYFTLSPAGTIRVDEQGNTLFQAAAGGKHRHLITDGQQRARILEALMYLASEPPHQR
jgi:inosine-uridine nucleoside N-ribohydrolase